jgi:hypothetical protein
MSCARQGSTVDRLMKETVSALDVHLSDAERSLDRKWNLAKQNLKNVIMREYDLAFPKSNWSLTKARQRGVMVRIEKQTRHVLENFLAVLSDDFKKRKYEVYRESMLRHAWVISQVVPGKSKIVLPNKRLKMKESISVYTGSAAEIGWAERMGEWLGSYHSSLNRNLALTAMNESPIQDTTAKVDSTKTGSPAYDIFDALARIQEAELWGDAMEAEDDFYQDNFQELGLVEVWKTRYGSLVCDDCDANEGLTADEAEGYIPLHPNCRCFWRIVPASFKDLLEKGDADSRALAYYMDTQGIVPDSMLVRNKDGSVGAKVIVSFDKWLEGQPQAVGMFQ